MSDVMCPCGSSIEFFKCCEPYLNDKVPCTTPEQLMRSRYTAFSLNYPDYLLHTSSIQLKAELSRQSLVDTIEVFSFIKLEVIETKDNFVTFHAHLLNDNEYHQLKETSTFVQEQGLWKYDSGKLHDIPTVKLSRNDLCPCGSNKKFKKCHQA